MAALGWKVLKVGAVLAVVNVSSGAATSAQPIEDSTGTHADAITPPPGTAREDVESGLFEQAGNESPVAIDSEQPDDENAASIAPGGELTPGGDPVTVEMSSSEDIDFTFEKTAGQRFSIWAHDATYSGTQFAVGVLDGSEQGTYLVSNGGASERFGGPYYFEDLPVGTNTIRIQLRGPIGSSGTLQLQLFEVPHDTVGAVDINGDALPVDVTVPGHAPTVNFYGFDGQDVTLHIADSTLDDPNCRVVVYRPNGTSYWSNYCDTASTYTPTLTETGEYSITVYPAGPGRIRDYFDLGTIALSVSSSNGPVLPSSCLDSDVVPIMLVHGLRRGPSDWNVHRPFLVERVEEELVVDGVPAADAATCAPIFVRAITVDGLGNVFDNADTVLAELTDLAAETSSISVDVVGHSKGGLDARAAIEGSPLAGQLITLGTPNGGTKIADLGCAMANSSSGDPSDPLNFQSAVARRILDKWFGPCDSTEDAVYQLTETYVQDTFNSIVVEGGYSDAQYRTIAGDSSCLLCRFVVGPITGGANDGLVSVSSVQYLANRGYVDRGVFDRDHGQLLTDEDMSGRIYCAFSWRSDNWTCPESSASESSTSAQGSASEPPEDRTDVFDNVAHFDSLEIGAGNDATLTIPRLDVGEANISLLADHESLSATAGGTEFVADGLGLATTIDSANPVEVTVSNPNTELASVLAVVTADVSSNALDVQLTDSVSPAGEQVVAIVTNPPGGAAEPTSGLSGVVTTPDGASAGLEFIPYGPVAVAPFTPTATGDHMVTVVHEENARRIGTQHLTATAGAASLPGTFSEDLDVGTDGLADNLDIAVAVDVVSEGAYSLSGTLAMPDGTIIASEKTTGNLGAGSQELTLSFPGPGLYAAGADGPYDLADLTLFSGTSVQAQVESAGQTDAYQANTFRPTEIVPSFVSTPDADEGETSLVEIPVELSQPVNLPVTVDYQSVTPEGYAQSPEDFEAVSGTLTFLPGETAKTVAVNVNGGRLTDGQDQLTVLVGFTNPSKAVVGGFYGLGGITISSDG